MRKLYGIGIIISVIASFLTAGAVHADDYQYPKDDGKPITVTEIPQILNYTGIGALYTYDPLLCMDRNPAFNAVIFVKYVDREGNTLGYSNDFKFKVNSFNPYARQPYHIYSMLWNGIGGIGYKDISIWSWRNPLGHQGIGQVVGQKPINAIRALFDAALLGGEDKGAVIKVPVDDPKDPLNFLDRAKCSPPSLRGNAIKSLLERSITDKTITAESAEQTLRGLTKRVPAYWFSGTGLSRYILNCNTDGLHSAGFRFRMLEKPGDVPGGKTGRWLQDDYQALPFIEDKVKKGLGIQVPTGWMADLNRSYIGIEFKYQVDTEPAEFTLKPSIRVGTTNINTDGDNEVTGITAKVQNETPTGDNSGLSHSSVSRFVVRKTDRNDTIDNDLANPGTSVSADHTRAAQEYIENKFKGTEYKNVANPDPQRFGPGSKTILENAKDLLDFKVEVGDRVCYMTSVQRPKHTDDNTAWAHSAPACIAVSARPHLQVRSGDVMVGNKIITSITNRTTDGTKRTYGSWGEYGAIAGNSISNFGSGAVYRMGMPDNRRNLGFLSFANTPNHGNYGTVNDGSNTLAQFFSKMPAQGKKVTGAAPTLDLSSLTGHHVIRPEANIKLQGSLQSGTSVIILMKAGKTAQVTGNIQTPDRYSSTGDISQLVIAPAGDNSNFNIHVAAAATRVDAWMIAPAGRIDTCNNSLTLGSREAPRRGNGCENSLFVNGPVAAKAFLLGRTGGRDKANDGPATQSLPAENFNLRQDAYLWIANQVNSSGARYITTQSVDLPPRY